MAIQEHKVDEMNQPAMEATCRKDGWSIKLSPTSPCSRTPAGGVAVLTREPRNCTRVRASTSLGVQAEESGRYIRTAINVAKGVELNIVNLYGEVGGHRDHAAADTTDEGRDGARRLTAHAPAGGLVGEAVALVAERLGLFLSAALGAPPGELLLVRAIASVPQPKPKP